MSHFRILILILIGIGMQQAFAQRPYYRPQVHQVDVQLFSANYLPDLSSKTNKVPLGLNPVNGLRYKYHYSIRTALRLGAFYRTAKYTADNYAGFTSDYSAKTQYIDLRAGFEYKYHKQFWQLYGGADALLSFGKFDETGFAENAASLTENDYQQISYGAGAFVGIRYFISTNLSVGLENELYFRMANFNQSGNKIENELFIPTEAVGMNVLSLNVSFHMVRMRKRCTCGRP